MTIAVNSSQFVGSQIEADLEDMLEAYEADVATDPANQPAADGKPSSYVPPASRAEQFLISRIAKANSTPLSEADLENKLDCYLDKNGRATGHKPTAYNATLILQNDPKTHQLLSLDLFSGNVRINKSFDPKVVGVMKIHCKPDGENFWDDHEAALKTWLVAPQAVGGWGLNQTAADMAHAVRNAAYQNARHPIYEKITSVPWDGKPRVDQALTKYWKLDPRDAPYNEQVSRLFFLAPFVRLVEPGHKYDSLPVIQGQVQGTGKSTFIAECALGREYAGELNEPRHINDSKVMNEMTHGKWFEELPELAAIMGTNAETVKSKLSSRSDRSRGAYSKYVEDRPRSFVMVATTNTAQYLKDPTGNRRFLPIKIGLGADEVVDLEAFRAEIQQIYAEVQWIYREMRQAQPEGDLPLFPQGEAEKIALRLQGEAAHETPEQSMASWIEYWITTPAADRNTMEIGSRYYRSAFCAQHAFTEYHKSMGRESVPDYDRKAQIMMGTAIQLAKGVSEGKKQNHDPYGRQRTFYVDPIWLAEQVAVVDEAPEAEAAEEVADAKPITTSLFEKNANVVPLSKTRDDLMREEMTF